MLLAMLAFAPSEAAASCGDYVMLGGAHSHHGTSPAHERQTTGNDEQRPDDSAPCRCQVPGCSNGSLPPIVALSDFKLKIERWATVLCMPGAAASSLNHLPTEPRIAFASGCDLGILRPPR
jgi:hypothetical protein